MNSQSVGHRKGETKIYKVRGIELGNPQRNDIWEIFGGVQANNSLPHLSSEPNEKPENRLSK